MTYNNTHEEKKTIQREGERDRKKATIITNKKAANIIQKKYSHIAAQAGILTEMVEIVWIFIRFTICM